jgi:uncharacterized protein YndB with AHSA1/START domain
MAPRPPEQQPFARTRAWIHAIASKEREERFTREEQLGMVIFAHGLILSGVWLIIWLIFDHGLPQTPPLRFILCEVFILVMCFVVDFASPDPFISAGKKSGINVVPAEAWLYKHGAKFKGRLMAIALLIAYIVQFFALVSLLEATGGPIDSPFAQMALVIGIFTPFIANKFWMMGFAVVTTVVYYAIFVSTYGFESPQAQRPTPASFFAVNVMILMLAFALTLLYQNKREGRSITPEESRITITRIINAPRDLVWKAWTNPARLKQWFQVNGTSLEGVETDVRPGGAWQAKMRSNGDEAQWKGEYTEVAEPERLVFTISDQAGEDEPRTASVLLIDLKGKTQMVFQVSDRHLGYARSWSSVLDRMADDLAQS